MKNYFKISSFSPNGKRAYSLTGDHADLNEEQQKTAKIGEFIAFRQVERNTRTNDKGEVEECEPYTRNIVSYLGSKDGLISALSEPLLIDAEVEAAVKKETHRIAKEYKLEEVDA